MDPSSGEEVVAPKKRAKGSSAKALGYSQYLLVCVFVTVAAHRLIDCDVR